jgi:prevent-host-death family protein
MAKSTWTVATAKARFSEVIERAGTDGPQVVTKNGRKTAVVISFDEWERRARRKGSLVEFFMNSPLRGSGIRIARLKDLPRKIDL